MKILVAIHVITILTGVSALARTTYNFNSDWKLYVGDEVCAEKSDFDDSSWKNVKKPRSLGYVTLSFPTTSGKSLTIKLNGEASNRDAFGNIIEIIGTPDPTSSANKGGKNILGIVEAEIYLKEEK